MTRIEALMQMDWPEMMPDMPIRRATALLVEARMAAVPVVDDSGRLVGILSQKDCFRPALRASYYQTWDGSVADHMTTLVRTLPATTDIAFAAAAFIEHPHRAFPVLDAGRLVGILRRSDVLAALIQLG